MKKRPNLAWLESVLDLIKDHPNQIAFDQGYSMKRFALRPADRLQEFSQAIFCGALPDAETLHFVATAFTKYLDQNGDIDLEEAFGLRAKPKVGKASAVKNWEDKRSAQMRQMSRYRVLEGLSIEKAAQKVSEDWGDSELKHADTLSRAYKRNPQSKPRELRFKNKIQGK